MGSRVHEDVATSPAPELFAANAGTGAGAAADGGAAEPGAGGSGKRRDRQRTVRLYCNAAEYGGEGSERRRASGNGSEAARVRAGGCVPLALQPLDDQVERLRRALGVLRRERRQSDLGWPFKSRRGA